MIFDSFFLDDHQIRTYHPDSEGRSTVTAKDLCSPKRLIEAKVRVSRVMKIKVDSHEMVEVNKFLPMKVYALDRFDFLLQNIQTFLDFHFRFFFHSFYLLISHEEPFSEDQYRLIKFEVQLDNRRSLKLTESKANEYQFEGTATGICTVSFTAKNSNGGIIASPPIHVHVFAPLTLMPRELFLLPGARIQLQYYGGPRIRSEIQFYGRDINGIFSIDQETGMLQALKTGMFFFCLNSFFSLLFFEFILFILLGTGASALITATKDGKIIGSDQISVTVGHIQGISIYAKNHVIFQNESVVLEVRGNKNENPFSWFDLGFKFEWTVANERVIRYLHNRHSS